jgi:hypothetical protein
MQRLVRGLFLLCLVMLAGCDRDSLMAKFTPHPESEIARQAIDDWRTGHIDRVKPLMSSQLLPLADKLGADASLLPSTAPTSVKIIGANSTFGGDQKSFNLTYEYAFGTRYMVVNIVIFERGGRREIVGMHAQVNDQSIETANAFSLEHKGGAHYLMLFLACVSLGVSLTAFVICLCTRMRRRKVWWAIFTLIGVTTLHFNWSTGGFDFSPVSFLLFGASAMSSGYGPWILGVSFPMGAVWFLVQRKALTVSDGDAPTPPLPG